MSGKMQTFSGNIFDFGDIESNNISIVDISHALSLTCRYNGHCPMFYSVAEHSVHALHMAHYIGSKYPEEIKDRFTLLNILLHDASEAYLNDIVRPVKKSLRDYIEIEEKVQKHIINKLIEEPESYKYEVANKLLKADIKYFDQLMLIAEMDTFFPGSEVMVEDTSMFMKEYIDKAKTLIKCWDPKEAELEYLILYNVLINSLTPYPLNRL